MTTNLERLTGELRKLGQALFFPPNVKGWDGGRAWINSSTLIGRANFIVDLVRDGNTRFGGKTLELWCEEQKISDADAWIEWLVQTWLAVPPSAVERQRWLEDRTHASKAELLIAVAQNPKIHLS